MLVQFYWYFFDFVVIWFFGWLYLFESGIQLDWEVYLYEVIFIGFWLGDDSFLEVVFYGYVYLELIGMNEVFFFLEIVFWVEKNGGVLVIFKYEDVWQVIYLGEVIFVFFDSFYEGVVIKVVWLVEELKYDYV